MFDNRVTLLKGRAIAVRNIFKASGVRRPPPQLRVTAVKSLVYYFETLS